MATIKVVADGTTLSDPGEVATFLEQYVAMFSSLLRSRLVFLLGGVIIRHRQSSEMIATHWPVRSMGASARAVDTGACVARLCAPTAAVIRRMVRRRADFISCHSTR